MALIRCAKCGKEIDSNSISCNSCGATVASIKEGTIEKKSLRDFSNRQSDRQHLIIYLKAIILGLSITVVIMLVLVITMFLNHKDGASSAVSSKDNGIADASVITESPTNETPIVQNNYFAEEQKLLGKWTSIILVTESGLTTDTEASCYMIFNSDYSCVLSIDGDITNLNWKYIKSENLKVYYSVEANGISTEIAIDEDPTGFYNNLVLAIDDRTGIIFEKRS